MHYIHTTDLCILVGVDCPNFAADDIFCILLSFIALYDLESIMGLSSLVPPMPFKSLDVSSKSEVVSWNTKVYEV